MYFLCVDENERKPFNTNNRKSIECTNLSSTMTLAYLQLFKSYHLPSLKHYLCLHFPLNWDTNLNYWCYGCTSAVLYLVWIIYPSHRADAIASCLMCCRRPVDTPISPLQHTPNMLSDVAAACEYWCRESQYTDLRGGSWGEKMMGRPCQIQ